MAGQQRKPRARLRHFAANDGCGVGVKALPESGPRVSSGCYIGAIPMRLVFRGVVDHGPPPEVLHEVMAASSLRIPAGFLTFVWIVALGLDPDVLVERHEGGSGLAASRRGSSRRRHARRGAAGGRAVRPSEGRRRSVRSAPAGRRGSPPRRVAFVNGIPRTEAPLTPHRQPSVRELPPPDDGLAAHGSPIRSSPGAAQRRVHPREALEQLRGSPGEPG